ARGQVEPEPDVVEETQAGEPRAAETNQIGIVDQIAPVLLLVRCPRSQSLLGGAVVVDDLRLVQADTLAEFNSAEGSLNLVEQTFLPRVHCELPLPPPPGSAAGSREQDAEAGRSLR